MEKQIIINNVKTDFWIEDTGRLRNQKTKRWLKGGYNKGYHFYSLYWRGKQYLFYTHRLVAEYFIPNPDNLPIVHHLDGCKTNNLYTNLQWISSKDHAKTIPNLGKRPKRDRVPEVAWEDGKQFRQSPYYITKQGEVYNVSKKIRIRLENAGNYLRFSCGYNLKGKHFLVHRAVWEVFNGPIPEGYDIDHIDGNPKNNNLDNLQAITHCENVKRRKMDYSYTVNNFNRGTEKRSSTNNSESKTGIIS